MPSMPSESDDFHHSGGGLNDVNSGVFQIAELRARGATDTQIRRAVLAGDLIRLRSGWCARSGADPSVVTAVRHDGVLGCVSALQHRGAWVAPGYDAMHVRTSKSLRGKVARSCRGSGPPAPTCTAVDPVDIALGCAVHCMTAEHWIAACDSLLLTGDVSPSEVAAVVGARGRSLLSRCDPRSQPGTESIVRVRLRALRFSVVVQPKITGVGKVDLRVGRLLIECDSKAHHTSLANYQNDRRRDRTALRQGWMSMRVTYDDVIYGWDDVLTDITVIARADRHRMRRRNRPI